MSVSLSDIKINNFRFRFQGKEHVLGNTPVALWDCSALEVQFVSFTFHCLLSAKAQMPKVT